ncbi:MAG: hypothetical protein PHO99_04140 [Candidatus Methanomethylophilaceae archaeon]|jgi:hypothetical protein|nr:hypothetical protein [Candidatus Methanomethylophilaceae archaeon]MDD2779398.1 hypothetical protein [Candidatus Methanomethylophilaceae archaeon]MDD4119643.1 hypothetical protein [Candidatus Methanomethylophilaceae archaeon]MDD4454675.1 hypothetical protein [Candidatus Methanomethylophilaceae archaeon]
MTEALAPRIDGDYSESKINRIVREIRADSVDINDAIGWMEEEMHTTPYRGVTSAILDKLYAIKYPLKFSPEYYGPIYSGLKTATSRRSKKLDVGDIFYVPVPPYEYNRIRYVESLWEITGVETGTVENVCNLHHDKEGYNTSLQMAFGLKCIYPDLGPYSRITIHFFQVYKGDRKL